MTPLVKHIDILAQIIYTLKMIFKMINTDKI